jgi:hypothetical protein
MNELLCKYSVNRIFLTFACSCSPSPLDRFDHFSAFIQSIRYHLYQRKKHRQEQNVAKKKASPRTNHSSNMLCSRSSGQIRVEERVDELPPSYVAVAVRRGSSIGKIRAIYFKFAMGGDQYLGD